MFRVGPGAIANNGDDMHMRKKIFNWLGLLFFALIFLRSSSEMVLALTAPSHCLLCIERRFLRKDLVCTGTTLVLPSSCSVGRGLALPLFVPHSRASPEGLFLDLGKVKVTGL